MAEPSSASLVYASALAADAFARSLLQAHGRADRRMPRPSPAVWSAPICAASTPMASAACRSISNGCAAGLINPQPKPRAEAGDAGRGHPRRRERLRLRDRHPRHAGGDRDGARVRHRRGFGAALDAFRHGGVLRDPRGRGRLDGDGVLQRLAGDAAVGQQADAARHQSVLHGGAGRQASADHPRHVARGCRTRKNPQGRAPRRKHSAGLRARCRRPPDHRPEGRARRRRGAADRRAQGLRPRRCSWTFSAA